MTITHDLDLPRLGRWGCEQVPTALFWTVSGSHLYGFPSADSDVDLRGCFAAPLESLLGLRQPPETVENKGELGGLKVEGVSHDLGKYFRLLCKHNGYVLEQVLSPLVAFGSEFLERLRPLATRCVTRQCYHHYHGFLQTQRKLIDKEPIKKAKSLLYAYRVILTGIHLLETGELEPHLPTLNNRFRLSFIPELIAKKASPDRGSLSDAEMLFHREQLTIWECRLDSAFATSTLSDEAPVEELNRFLIELRLGRHGG